MSNDRRGAMSRRKFLGVMAGTAAALPFLDLSRVSLAAEKGKPKKGGQFIFPMDYEPVHFDPHISTNQAILYFTNMAMSGLLRCKTGLGSDPEKWQFIPDLAESYKQEDEVTYTFQLRKGVKWHNLPPVNGREFNAEDVKYSFERIATPKAGFDRRTMFTVVDKLEILDNYKIKFVLKEPYAPFIPYVASPFNKIVAREVVEKDGDAKKTLVGTGPFILESYDRGGYAVWKRNPDYFVKGLPYLDEVQMPVIKDPSSIVAAFRTKRVDWMWTSIATTAESVQKSTPEAVMEKFFDTGIYHLAFNLQKKPLDDVRVRQAIALTIDHEALIKTAFNGEGAKQTPVPIGFKEYAAPYDILPNYTRDIPKAKKLLAEAGLANGFKVTIQTNTYYVFAVNSLPVLKEQLKEVGIDAEIKIMESAAFLESRTRKDFEISWMAHLAFADPDEFITIFYGTDGSRNYGFWGSPELDKMLHQQRTTLDHKKRKEILYGIQKYLATQYYSIPTPMPYYYEFWHPYIKGFRAAPPLFVTIGFQGISKEKA